MDRGPSLPTGPAPRKGQPGNKRKSGFIDNSSAPSVSVGSSGRPSGSGAGPSRDTQRRATKAAVEARARDSEESEAAYRHTREADQSSEDSEHAAKVRRQQEQWKELLPGFRSHYVDSLPVNIARAKGHKATLQAALQAEIEGFTCCPHCPQPQPLHIKQPDGHVWYIGLDGCFELAMHKMKCACCNQNFSPHALDFGCFPSTPVTAHVWYDLRVLHLYKNYGPMDGLSATGRCEQVDIRSHQKMLIDCCLFPPSLILNSVSRGTYQRASFLD